MGERLCVSRVGECVCARVVWKVAVRKVGNLDGSQVGKNQNGGGCWHMQEANMTILRKMKQNHAERITLDDGGELSWVKREGKRAGLVWIWFAVG